MTERNNDINTSSGKKGRIFLGLGTNLGDRTENLRLALNLLSEKDISILQMSSVYETPPWGLADQPAFYNMVLEVGFEGRAMELLDLVLGVESELGRKRIVKWGPRLIDIDVLEFKGEFIEETRLRVPHPWYTQRAFVLVPLQEIAPDFIPSGQEKKLEELILDLGKEGKAILKSEKQL